MNRIFIIISFFACIPGFGQNISLKKAIRIAKNYSVTHIHKVDRTWLSTDSATKVLLWIVEEKVNVKKKIRKAGDGFTTIYASRLKINATNGEVVKREQFQIARVHKTPRF